MKALLFLLIMAVANASAQGNDDVPRYVRVQGGYLMVLRQGDDILAGITTLAEAEKIPSGNFTGMGFVDITFGYFNFDTKQYDPRAFEKVELSSLHGSIAWQGGKPSIHAHGTVAGPDFVAYAGHILNGKVSMGSLEILVSVHDRKLERVNERQLGANVLCLGRCE